MACSEVFELSKDDLPAVGRVYNGSGLRFLDPSLACDGTRAFSARCICHIARDGYAGGAPGELWCRGILAQDVRAGGLAGQALA